MNEELQDCFAVIIRERNVSVWHPEDAERRVASCPSYEDASEVREKIRRAGDACVIRCVGPTGGGD